MKVEAIPQINWHKLELNNKPAFGELVLLISKSSGLKCPFYDLGRLQNVSIDNDGIKYEFNLVGGQKQMDEVLFWASTPKFKID